RGPSGACAQSGSASSVAGRTTRLTESAAIASSSPHGTPAPTAPARSIALTSRWPARCGAISATRPVRMLTTPLGASDVARTSDSSIAGSGAASLATTTAVFPVTSTGASTLTSPSSDDRCGARTATTPVGSGAERLKYGPATGLALPATCAPLSVHPAYQHYRSPGGETIASAAPADTPSPATISCTNCARRPS